MSLEKRDKNDPGNHNELCEKVILNIEESVNNPRKCEEGENLRRKDETDFIKENDISIKETELRKKNPDRDKGFEISGKQNHVTKTYFDPSAPIKFAWFSMQETISDETGYSNV